MTDTLRELFKVEGWEGVNLERTKAAMEWFLSPAGREIGEKLLTDAYKRTGKPLTIVSSEIADPEYNPDVHILFINPSKIDMVVTIKSDGTFGKMSPEQVIAHELAHAGQNDDKEIHRKHIELNNKLLRDYNNALTPEKKAQLQSLTELARAAPTYEQAMKYVTRYVDEYTIPMQQSLNAALNKHPDHIEYVRKVELPAMEIENKVAAMTDGTVRDSYILPVESMRKLALREVASGLMIEDKPKEAEVPIPSSVRPREAQYVRG